eukprot:3107218-Prorocentrum_lima.AAC.1
MKEHYQQDSISKRKDCPTCLEESETLPEAKQGRQCDLHVERAGPLEPSGLRGHKFSLVMSHR